MLEPVLLILAGRVFEGLTQAVGAKVTNRLLGPADQRAIDRAIRTAAEEMVGSLPEAIGEASYIVRWLSMPALSELLIDSAFTDAAPNASVVADVLTELGYDPSTSRVDVVDVAVLLVTAIRREIRREADQSDGTLFNRLVLAKLDNVNDRLGRIAGHESPAAPSAVPPLPELFLGREKDIERIRTRLRPQQRAGRGMPVTVIRGWPGVGKSTFAAAVARDSSVNPWFPDGVLWAALSEIADVRGQLDVWFRQLGLSALRAGDSVEVAARLLAGRLRDAQMLIVVDDVWRTEDARPFLGGGEKCAAVVTTRLTRIAQDLDPDNYPLPVLADGAALELLAGLAPAVVRDHHDDVVVLVQELEGLPLALRVAGRLLAAERHLGWGVAELIVELREGVRILGEQAPPDRMDLVLATTPTVAALLSKSTDRLPPGVRSRFALLGAFAQKPATFDIDSIAAVWLADDARPDVRVLVGRGLLEPTGDGRFQLHALLAQHARSLLTQGDV